MSGQTVARRYALALFELGVETNKLEELSQQVHDVAETVAGHRELQLLLTNPVVPLESRKAVFKEVLVKLGVSELVRNAMLLMLEHSRAGVLRATARALRDLADVKAGRVRASVTSAAALSEAQYGRLQGALEKMTGRKVALDRKVDPTLIGGVVTRLGDKVFDGSVKARLAELRQSLLPN